MICGDADRINDNDRLRVDAETGRIVNMTKNESYQCETLPDHIMDIIKAGGLFLYLKHEREAE